MTIRLTGAFFLAAAIVGGAGCSGGSSPPSDECSTACRRVVTCATPSAYAYSFDFGHAYSFGYGQSYGYGGPDLQQCLNDCAAVPQSPRDRIAQCVISASDCLTLLQCH